MYYVCVDVGVCVWFLVCALFFLILISRSERAVCESPLVNPQVSRVRKDPVYVTLRRCLETCETAFVVRTSHSAPGSEDVPAGCSRKVGSGSPATRRRVRHQQRRPRQVSSYSKTRVDFVDRRSRASGVVRLERSIACVSCWAKQGRFLADQKAFDIGAYTRKASQLNEEM